MAGMILIFDAERTQQRQNMYGRQTSFDSDESENDGDKRWMVRNELLILFGGQGDLAAPHMCEDKSAFRTVCEPRHRFEG